MQLQGDLGLTAELLATGADSRRWGQGEECHCEFLRCVEPQKFLAFEHETVLRPLYEGVILH